MKTPNRWHQPTLRDISEKTNLTVPTVSRILSGKPGFSNKTVEYVKSVAESLGYRHNRLVSGMQTGRTGIIGAILPVHAEWGAQLLTGLIHELATFGYVPIVLDCPSPAMTELEMINHLLERRIEGVVLFPSDDTVSDRYFKEIYTRKIPLITTVRRLEQVNCPFVGGDDLKSGRLAAKHLIELGHRKLGHLSGVLGMSTGADRARGFESVAKAKLGVSVTREAMPGFLPERKRIRDFLKNNPDITAIYCANEAIAVELYSVARSLRISIPKKLSVIAHGGGKLSPLLHPALTSLTEDSFAIGQNAANVLLKVIQGKLSHSSANVTVVETRLIERESTAPPPTVK
ncbi:MAG: LacI family DNA-binding transcriptional regulator [Verrucomicrobiota bacterium JB024]|nr:LacI family DNA-binding transcriptional regulator [Verrucomicrobiota bacterium JB024]